MLGGLLGSSFGSKCKSLLRVTLMRVELVQRKRRATERILKKDLADLLATRLELDAYKRAEGLLAELRISSGYDFIEDSCHWLLRHISSIGRRKECPNKCKEAVASLMFAAAWFSDLPELRDLRDLFHNRYGKSMEFYVNQRFAESWTNKHYSVEKKLRLMEQVAAEFSVKWNPGSFKKRICRDFIPPVVGDQVKRNRSIDAPPEVKECVKPREGSKMGHKPTEGKEKAIMSRITWYSLLHHDKKMSVKYKPGAKNENRDKKDVTRPKKQTHYLVKGNVKKGVVCPSDIRATYHLSRDDQASDDKLQQSESKKPAVQLCQCGLNKNLSPGTGVVRVQPRVGILTDEANHNDKLDRPIVVEQKLAEPMRSGRTLQISIQDVSEEEEEIIIDKLLIKYSRNPHTPEKLRVEAKSQPSKQISMATGKADDTLALVPSTSRSISLPNEKTVPADSKRALIRVSSCQPTRVASHVHPKLPDYEDLAAKFAALKQQQQRP